MGPELSAAIVVLLEGIQNSSDDWASHPLLIDSLAALRDHVKSTDYFDAYEAISRRYY